MNERVSDKGMPSVTELAQELAPGRTVGEAIDSVHNACTFRHVCRLMKRRLLATPPPVAATGETPRNLGADMELLDEVDRLRRELAEAKHQTSDAMRNHAEALGAHPSATIAPTEEAWIHRSGLLAGALSRLLAALKAHPSYDLHPALDNAKEVMAMPLPNETPVPERKSP